MKFRLLLPVIFLFAAMSAAQDRGFTIEQVMSSPFPTQLTSAAHANRIAWVFDSKGERNVWVADAPNFEARQITHYQGDDGQDILALALTPDGKTAVYSRGSELNNTGNVANPTSETKEPKQQVWAVDVETGKTQLLGDMGCEREDCEDVQISPDGRSVLWVTKHHVWLAPVAGSQPARPLTQLRGDELNPQWSPDGRQIAFQSDRRDHSFIVIYDVATERVRYVSPSVDRDFAPRWSPDGKQIAFIRTPGAQNYLPVIPQRPQPWALWLADAATAEARELWHSGTGLNDSLPPYAAKSLKFGNGRIIFASEKDGRNHLYSIAAFLPAMEVSTLTPGDFDVEDVALSPDLNVVLYTSNQGDIDRRHIWAVSMVYGAEYGRQWSPMPPVPLTQGPTIEWEPLLMADGHTVVCFGSTATSPAMPYRLTGLTNGLFGPTRSKGREMIARSVLPADFPSDKLVEPQQVVFRSEDGQEVHGQLFLPKRRPASGRGPAVVFAHGGPPRQMMLGFHYMYYYHNSYAENQYLAGLGYVVLSVNYRLGSMYGRAFREAPNSGWRGSSEYKDVLAGGKYLQSLPYVDPKRIGIWGGSYGGLMTALALSRNSDVFAAGVDFHGVHDWSGLVARRLPDTAPDYKEAIKLAYDSSPIASVSTWKSPVLLMHGDDDRNVSFTQTTDLVQRLRENHVPFEEIIFPDEIHDFLLWKTWIRGYKATAEFFDKAFF